MELRTLVSDHLPNAVVAAAIFTLYNAYTDGISDPVTIGFEFISYVIAIFIGFVVITPILDKVFDSVTT
ncbi:MULTISPECIES: hypothetical protein [Haloarcula]|uniref:Uncharacterized protein n=1 Tax=Haloarcula argentinensis TaxID=43776 RepID=A0A847UKA6_HALAR|nr:MULTISPECIES: hypothetical protein [Haloarcula]KZX48904.1 hypothetical protein AV929_19900 [Haloarcula sp. K1]NLV12140.1 hypothetical protein [Haloarcula argentinensis]